MASFQGAGLALANDGARMRQRRWIDKGRIIGCGNPGYGEAGPSVRAATITDTGEESLCLFAVKPCWPQAPHF